MCTKKDLSIDGNDELIEYVKVVEITLISLIDKSASLLTI